MIGKGNIDVNVLYKFISKDMEIPDSQVHQGTSKDLSSTGITLRSMIPDAPVLYALVTGKTYVGLNIILPTREAPIKALSRCVRIEIDEQDPRYALFGLKFVTIEKADKDELVRFTIRSQITH
jgi:c-di-GMP-binding flagellar brake protein YcgR